MFQYGKYILIIVGLALAIYFFVDYRNQRSERERESANYESALKELANVKNLLTTYQFENKTQLKEYVNSTNNQLNGVLEQLEENNIKLNRVTKIVSTTVHTRDTIINRIDLDSFASKLSMARPFKLPFEDKTDCFIIKGSFDFDGQTYSLNFKERTYNDTINHITSYERQKHRWLFGIKTGIFGRKVYKVTLVNSCGESKTIVINKK